MMQATAQPHSSIGMPVYNGAASLEAVLPALRHQTLADVEIINSDNGSTDNTPKICERAAADDPLIESRGYCPAVPDTSTPRHYTSQTSTLRAPSGALLDRSVEL
jgi:glycosyltransferase involved in cell wall biosynthesis